jgi:hypothetical protein
MYDSGRELNNATLWHDLKTILTATQAGLFLLRDNPNDLEILQSVEKGVNQAVLLAKCAQENFAESFIPNLTNDTPTSIEAVLSQVIEVFKPLAYTKNVYLDYDFSEDSLILVKTPPGVITQVFSNLLSNAIKYSVSKKVTISLLSTNDLILDSKDHKDNQSFKEVTAFSSDPNSFTGGFKISSDFTDLSKIMQLFTISRKDDGDNSFNLGFPSITHLLNMYGAELVLSERPPVCFYVLLP